MTATMTELLAVDAEFSAFVAGFELSREGFNGEYVSRSRYPGGKGLLEALYERFKTWKEETR